jgi:N-acetylmuramoyl-L-alanine amidase
MIQSQKKLENDLLLQELEIRLKEKEIRKRIIFQPTFVTIFVAFLGLIGAAISNYLQRQSQLEIEEKKFQYSVYQTALGAKDNITAAKILDFYIKAKLLPGEQGKYSKLLEEGKTNEIPTYGGIYKDIKIPNVDNSEEYFLKDNFLKGKGIEYNLSYNARKRLNRNELTKIVLHSTISTNFKFTANIMADTLNGHSSAHLLIGRDGKVIQLVPFNYVSYHSGKFNTSSIGIEFLNVGPLKKTKQGYLDAYGREVDKSLVESNSSGKYWGKYTEIQIETARKICTILLKEYGINEIVGHSEIDSIKVDPGPFFPIQKFKSLIK